MGSVSFGCSFGTVGVFTVTFGSAMHPFIVGVLFNGLLSSLFTVAFSFF